MTHEEKVNYLRIALSLQKIGVDNRTADQVIMTYEKVQELGGEFTLKDAVEIETTIGRKYAKSNNRKSSNRKSK